MKKALLAVAALTCMGSAALAGPNAGGTLIAALSVGTVYTTDNTGYCGSSTTGDCNGAVTHADGDAIAVINIIAAFPGPSRLAGLTFGVVYPEADGTSGLTLVEWAGCGDFELANSDWPASGSGTAVTWSTAQTAQLVETYWFAAVDYYGTGATLALAPHPSHGGNFADDSVPSQIDPIAAFGVFGFNTAGDGPCPGAAPGACCFENGDCLVLLEQECAAAGGSFQGEGVTCEDADCPQPVTGACCIGTDCVILTVDECEARDGEYKGDNVPCEADTCAPVPVIESSWGNIKNNYR
jgi:hypothetical protein